MREKLTPLQNKILNEIVKPSINRNEEYPYSTKFFIMANFSESLNFTELLKNIKGFYIRNGGKDWEKVLLEVY